MSACACRYTLDVANLLFCILLLLSGVGTVGYLHLTGEPYGETPFLWAVGESVGAFITVLFACIQLWRTHKRYRYETIGDDWGPATDHELEVANSPFAEPAAPF